MNLLFLKKIIIVVEITDLLNFAPIKFRPIFEARYNYRPSVSGA